MPQRSHALVICSCVAACRAAATQPRKGSARSALLDGALTSPPNRICRLTSSANHAPQSALIRLLKEALNPTSSGWSSDVQFGGR